eukprot:223930_1
MGPPKSITCNICGDQHLKPSFAIHYKSCKRKWQAQHSTCQKCYREVHNTDWGAHRKICKSVVNRRKSRASRSSNVSQKPKQLSEPEPTMPPIKRKFSQICEECERVQTALTCKDCEQSLCRKCDDIIHAKGARKRHKRIYISEDRPFNGQFIGDMPSEFADENADQHLEQCTFCDRKFLKDRVSVHEVICKKISAKAHRRKFDGPHHRVQGTVFEEFEYKRSSTPPLVRKWRKEGRRWKRKPKIASELKEFVNASQNVVEHSELPVVIFAEPPGSGENKVSKISKTNGIRPTVTKREIKNDTRYSARSRKIENNPKHVVRRSAPRISNKSPFPAAKNSDRSARNSASKIRSTLRVSGSQSRSQSTNLSNNKNISLKENSRIKKNISRVDTGITRSKKLSNANKSERIRNPVDNQRTKPVRKVNNQLESNSDLDISKKSDNIKNTKPKTMNEYRLREKARISKGSRGKTDPCMKKPSESDNSKLPAKNVRQRKPDKNTAPANVGGSTKTAMDMKLCRAGKFEQLILEQKRAARERKRSRLKFGANKLSFV